MRPATIAVAPLTPAQRVRQRAATETAHAITEASWHGTWLDYGAVVAVPLPVRPEFRDTMRAIVDQAPALAADPPAGAVRIGRNGRGHLVVAVLHTPTWSLLLRPANPYPAAWAYLDEFGELAIVFGGDGDLLSVEWDEMADTVLATLTPPPPSQPR